MSLRTRLFFLFGGLLFVLLLAQIWMWQMLSDKLERELGSVAFAVGRDMASVFSSDSDTHVYRFEHDADPFASNGPKVEVIGREDAPDRAVWVEQQTVKRIKTGNSTSTTVEPAYRTEIHVIEKSDGTVKRKFVTRNQTMVLDQIEDEPILEPDPIATSETEEDVQIVVDLDTRVQGNTDPSDSHTVVLRGRSVDGETKVNWTARKENVVLTLDDPAKANFLIMQGPSFQTRIPIPKRGVDETLNEVKQQFLAGSMGILFLGLLVAAMAAHRFAQPLRRLADTAQRVGEGELGLQVTAPAQRGELGIAVREFNKMSTRLRELDAHAQAMRQRKYLSELGEIANGLAHTIRNPLNTLGLSVEQMAAPELAPDLRREMAHTARQQIRRIDQWIRSFLALASQGVAREDALHIDSLIQDVVLEIAQDGAREVELQVELTEDVPAFPGVAPELRAVLQALVVNAVEASPPGGVVRIETSAADHELCIRVADEGPGLPEVVRGKLFTPHVTTKETGSGMGLFLAHRIITSRYDGAVTLSDRPEGGTVAAISIPLQRSGDYV